MYPSTQRTVRGEFDLRVHVVRASWAGFLFPFLVYPFCDISKTPISNYLCTSRISIALSQSSFLSSFSLSILKTGLLPAKIKKKLVYTAYSENGCTSFRR